MAARLQGWFARQSLTVKLLLAVPLLLAALFWSALPGSSPRTPDAGNQPVLSGSNARGTVDGTPAPNGTAAAQPLLPHQEPQPADTGLSWSTGLRTLVSVGVVIVLILLSAQGLKYVMAGAAQPLRSSHTIHVLETLHLPSPTGRGRSSIHLIEVGEQILLVGATDTQLSLLAELPDDEAAARLRRTAAEGAPRPTISTSFAEHLASANGSSSGSGSGSGSASDTLNGRSRDTANGTAPRSAPDEADLTRLLERLRQSKQRLEEGL